MISQWNKNFGQPKGCPKQTVDKLLKGAKKASQSSPKANKLKSIFVRACTAQKYKELGNVQAKNTTTIINNCFSPVR